MSDGDHTPECVAVRGGEDRWPQPSTHTLPALLTCPHTTHEALRIIWGHRG